MKEKEAVKMYGKSELREVEGGEFEMVSLASHSFGESTSSTAEELGGERESAARDQVVIRDEAYGWPRVVAPPMKRAGHVILDTCFPDGEFLICSTLKISPASLSLAPSLPISSIIVFLLSFNVQKRNKPH